VARLLISAGICGLLSGCATSPVSYSEAVPVPTERILSRDLATARPDTGHITVSRDSGLMGAACTSRVFVDGKPIALMRNGERVDVYIEPGDHVLGVRPDGFCGARRRRVLNYPTGSGSDTGSLPGRTERCSCRLLLFDCAVNGELREVEIDALGCMRFNMAAE